MKRRVPVFILSLMAAGSLPAQSPPSYQEPYDAWIRNGAGLERDASVARERLAIRTDRAAAEAVKYENARKEASAPRFWKQPINCRVYPWRSTILRTPRQQSCLLRKTRS